LKRALHLTKLPRFLWRKILVGFETIRGYLDSTKLQQRFPQLKDYDALAGPVRNQLQPYYDEYISEMSTEAMAIGFESAVFLTVLCHICTPQKILDLGSGFSSLVFRLYAATADYAPSVWSVDDELTWLETTRNFLISNRLASDNLVHWQTFIEARPESFDLVLHDLGRMPFRTKTLRDAIALAHTSGLIVLDDIHKDEYRSHVKRVLKEMELPFYSLRAFTKDRFGRYCYLVTP
jgi:predicted O-methyltransferase YrrM